MADFQLSVDLDTQGILRSFKQIESEAAASGRKTGLGFEDSLNRFGKRSIAALSQELARLQSRQIKLNIDSTAFAKTGAKIRELEGLIAQANRRQLSVNADPKSLVMMRQKVADLTAALERVKVGSPAFRNLKTDIRIASDELVKAEKAAGGAKGAFAGLAGTLAGFVSGAALIGFLKSSVNEAIALESVTRKLSNTLGSQGAAGALAFTKGLSDKLGLSFKTLSSGFASFTAAATAANVPIGQQKELFAAVAKTGQSLGMSNDEISGSLLALQQVASKGVVQMEELRGQLGERMPIAFAATAKGLGITTKELITLVESGKLTSQQFFPALTKGLNELTEAAGGAETTAQKLAKLENAWVNLQTQFGQSALPAVTGFVEQLTQGLRELEVQQKKLDLNRTFGLVGAEAEQLVGTLEQIQTKYNLSWQEAKNLLGAQIKSAGAAKSTFGILNMSGEQFSQIQLGIIDGAIEYRKINRDIKADELAKSQAEMAAADRAKAALDAKKAELGVQLQLTDATQQYAAAQAKAAQDAAGLAIAQRDAVQSYGKAIGDVEQSRFDIAKSFNQYELGKLQERGASEGQLRAKRKEGEAIELAALQAKIRQQQASQQIEIQTLAIKQQAARTEADQSLRQAVIAERKAALELSKAELITDQQKREEAVALAQLALESAGIDRQAAQEKLAALGKLQPLEAATVFATQETANNQLKAEAAANGYGVAVDGTLVKVKGMVGSFEGLATVTGRTVGEAQQLADMAHRVGLEAKIGADGTIQIGQAIKGAQGGANVLAGSFTKVGDKAPVAAQGARDFAGFLAKGQGFAKGIADQRLDSMVGSAASKAQGLSTQMGNAARAADYFYQSLLRASGLPGARWAGGPVEAGQTYRINDGPGGRSLGQEAFLSSSGRLSLINRPANSLWVAPSRGLVVPAGVTEQLKAAGAAGPARVVSGVRPRVAGGDPATAALAVEVSKLRAEVGELNRKKWDVHVRLQQDGSGLRMQKLLNSIR